VEAAELRHEGVGDGLVVGFAGAGEVKGLDRRLRQSGGDDAVVDRLQLGGGAPGKDHRGAVTGVGEARGAADAVAGAGDQDDAARQQVGGGQVVAAVGNVHVANPQNRMSISWSARSMMWSAPHSAGFSSASR